MRGIAHFALLAFAASLGGCGSDSASEPLSGGSNPAILLDAYAGGEFAARAVGLFVDAGADLNHRDAAHETLLIHAARDGDLAMVQALLEHRADAGLTDHHGWSALNHAIQKDHPAVALALLEAGVPADEADMHDNTPLQYAVNLVSDPRVVAALVARGADVNRPGPDGMTPLMEAIAAGNPAETVEALLQGGARLDATDASGRTARDYAEERGDEAVIALFAGATPAPSD